MVREDGMGAEQCRPRSVLRLTMPHSEVPRHGFLTNMKSVFWERCRNCDLLFWQSKGGWFEQGSMKSPLERQSLDFPFFFHRQIMPRVHETTRNV